MRVGINTSVTASRKIDINAFGVEEYLVQPSVDSFDDELTYRLDNVVRARAVGHELVMLTVEMEADKVKPWRRAVCGAEPCLVEPMNTTREIFNELTSDLGPACIGLSVPTFIKSRAPRWSPHCRSSWFDLEWLRVVAAQDPGKFLYKAILACFPTPDTEDKNMAQSIQEVNSLETSMLYRLGTKEARAQVKSTLKALAVLSKKQRVKPDAFFCVSTEEKDGILEAMGNLYVRKRELTPGRVQTVTGRKAMKEFFAEVHKAFTCKQSVSSEDVKTINQYKFLLSDTDSMRYVDLVRASMQTLAADAKDGGSGIICAAIMADAPAPSEPRMGIEELLEITQPSS